MFNILVAFFAAALGVGFWLDNAILHPILQFWWLLLVAAFLLLCIQLPESRHRFIQPPLIVATTGVLALLSIWLLDDVMTIYVVGAIFVTAAGVGNYTATYPGTGFNQVIDKPLMILIAITLVILPVSVNRILVKLPNLSAGTSITLLENKEAIADLDARFYNRINDKLEIEVYLGSQFYIDQPHEVPLLKIETGINKVVVRLLSISYEHRLAYVDLPLFELKEERLLDLQLVSDSAPVEMEIDRIFLLMSGFKVGDPVLLQLPHMDSHEVSLGNRLLIVVFRLLLWAIVCFSVVVWFPRERIEIRLTHGA